MSDENKELATTSTGFDVEKLEGVEKAAILLLSLSEEDAAQILKHLEPKQVQQVGTAMAAMDDFTQEKITAVHKLFINEIQNFSTIGFQSEDFVLQMLFDISFLLQFERKAFHRILTHKPSLRLLLSYNG